MPIIYAREFRKKNTTEEISNRFPDTNQLKVQLAELLERLLSRGGITKKDADALYRMAVFRGNPTLFLNVIKMTNLQNANYSHRGADYLLPATFKIIYLISGALNKLEYLPLILIRGNASRKHVDIVLKWVDNVISDFEKIKVRILNNSWEGDAILRVLIAMSLNRKCLYPGINIKIKDLISRTGIPDWRYEYYLTRIETGLRNLEVAQRSS